MPDQERLLRELTGEKREKFDAFRALLTEYNKKFNLTAVTDEREMLYKHFLDSVMGEELFPMSSHVAEVGSGAGFPSVPLKLLRDDLTFTLFESNKKKCEFLGTVRRELGLTGMEILPLRAEEAGRGEYREKFDVCCARAVARLNTLAEYCLPLVRTGGVFVAYKGRAEEELKEAERAIAVLGGGSVRSLNFSLPEGMGERQVISIKKQAKTPAKYPRGRGKERSDPIL